MHNDDLGFTTRLLHSDPHDRPYRAHAVPIMQSSSFAFEDSRQGARIFGGEEKGHIYTRIGNPTIESLEQVLANIEGAKRSVVFSSGMAALTAAIMATCKAGDSIVASGTMYGPTVKLAREVAPRFGIASTIVRPDNPESFIDAITPTTKLILFETPSNPRLDIIDTRKVATAAKARGVLTAVDATFATPVFLRPLEHGADMSIHSATKYLNGHADVIAGVVSCSDPELGKAVATFRSFTGACSSPFDAYLFLRGLRTLSLRMEAHNRNAMKVAEFLEGHPALARTWYPGLKSHSGHEVAKQTMSGFGGMVSFEMAGGYDAAVKLLDNLKLITLVISLGAVDSIISHPASMTHSGMPRELRLEQGITDGLVRLSVGVVDVEDIIADLEQALDM